MIFPVIILASVWRGAFLQDISGQFSGNPGTGADYVKEGTRVGFDCTLNVTVHKIQIFTRMNNIKQVAVEVQDNYTLDYSFPINRTFHLARFSCKAFNNNGDLLYSSGEKWYRVRFTVSSISLTRPQSTEPFSENQNVTISCITNEGFPTPQINWTRDGQPINPRYETIVSEELDGEYEYKKTQNTLSITVQKSMHMALYVCYVQGLSHLQKNYSFEVQFYPSSNELSLSPSEAVSEGEWQTVTCTTDSSNPQAHIEWWLDDSLVEQPLDGIVITEDVGNTVMYNARGVVGQMRIQMSELRDGWEVQCRVTVQDTLSNVVYLDSLTQSHVLKLRVPSKIYIYAGAAAGGTFTLVLLITVIIVLAQRKRKAQKNKKDKSKEGGDDPDCRYDHIIDASTLSYDRQQDKPKAGSYPLQDKKPSVKENTYVRDSGSSSTKSYENWDKALESLDQLSLTSIVHEGRFTTVKAGTPKQGSGLYPQQQVAAKILRSNTKDYYKQMFYAELRYMKVIKSHDNIVELLAFVETKKHPAIITQYYEAGDLQHFLRSRSNSTDISSRDLIGMVQDVACGMKYLTTHQPPFLHHQLSACHILVGPRMLCKVTGFSSEDAVREREHLEQKHKLEVDTRWRPPELLNHISWHSVTSDVWAFGVLFMEVATFGGVPYPGLSSDAVQTYVIAGDVMARPSFVYPQIYELMKQCWAWHPHDRPSFTFIITELEHLQSSAHQHIDVRQVFQPHIQEHIHGADRNRRRNFENMAV